MTTTTAQSAAQRAVLLAAEILDEAFADAYDGRWSTFPEQRYDAARYILDGARLLPGFDSCFVGTPSPLIGWSDDADGFVPTVDCRAAIRGDEAAGLRVFAALSAWTAR